MFSKWFSRQQPEKPQAPEIMGLYLGGSFRIDPLKLKLLEPELVIDGAASQHLIQAVGEAHLDSGGKLLRFYTDDDAFLQIVLDGGDTENHITDVKLWHFYQTQSVGSDAQWKQLIDDGISQPNYSLSDYAYQRVWDSVGDSSPPVAVTETTWEEDGDTSQTDQFMMLYERPLNNEHVESLLVCGEEKIVGHNADRCLVTSTGINIQPADITIVGV